MKNLEKTTRKNFRVRSIGVLLTLVCIFGGAVSCSMFRPLTKEESAKRIIKNLFDGCKAGKNADVAVEMDKIIPLEQRRSLNMSKIDYSNPASKNDVDRFCTATNDKYGGGYEFGKTTEQGEVLGVEVFPTGANNGQKWEFKKEGENFVVADTDPAKR